jgi:hypothetical protein
MNNTINLSINTGKKKVVINEDESKVIYLDTGDINILTRVSDSLKEIEALQANADTATLKDDSNDNIQALAETLTDIDNQLRTIVNNIFDYDVCTPIAGKVSLLKIVDGKPLVYTIIDTLSALYKEDIITSYNSIRNEVEQDVKKALE